LIAAQISLSSPEPRKSSEIIARHLPATTSTIVDVGGGPGRYALRLASQGHAVHLLDPVAIHIEQARSTAGGENLISAQVGNALSLPWPDGFADAVILLGPLYHLVERDRRIECLREAYRVSKPGAVLFAAAINRFVSSLEGVFEGLFADPAFVTLANRDLESGRHLPAEGSRYFATAYFHRPDELQSEIIEAGFQLELLLAVEGPFWLLDDFDDAWRDDERRAHILRLSKQLEAEPSLLGSSAHLLAVARKPF
jgi:ubiquinone/menaquinone biosynthesis C-methylase UbiE